MSKLGKIRKLLKESASDQPIGGDGEYGTKLKTLVVGDVVTIKSDEWIANPVGVVIDFDEEKALIDFGGGAQEYKKDDIIKLKIDNGAVTQKVLQESVSHKDLNGVVNSIGLSMSKLNSTIDNIKDEYPLIAKPLTDAVKDLKDSILLIGDAFGIAKRNNVLSEGCKVLHEGVECDVIACRGDDVVVNKNGVPVPCKKDTVEVL